MRSLPLPEVLRFLELLPTKYAAILAIGVTTGCRITEVLNLRRFDLLTKQGKPKDEIAFLKLKSEKKRAGETELPSVRHRKIRIPEPYWRYVIKHLREEEARGHERPDDYVFRGILGRHLRRQSVYVFFRKILGEGYGTHFMRKTFAQSMFRYFLEENVRDPMRALELTRQALDHARLDTTVKYLGITGTAIRIAQNAVFDPHHIKEKLNEENNR